MTTAPIAKTTSPATTPRTRQILRLRARAALPSPDLAGAVPAR
ncbi:MAG: hypothetical protein M0020_06295 [Actinomycetota bacterium]|nr:hypothetical protein [Actinomycetota bacterium]